MRVFYSILLVVAVLGGGSTVASAEINGEGAGSVGGPNRLEASAPCQAPAPAPSSVEIERWNVDHKRLVTLEKDIRDLRESIIEAQKILLKDEYQPDAVREYLCQLEDYLLYTKGVAREAVDAMEIDRLRRERAELQRSKRTETREEAIRRERGYLAGLPPANRPKNLPDELMMWESFGELIAAPATAKEKVQAKERQRDPEHYVDDNKVQPEPHYFGGTLDDNGRPLPLSEIEIKALKAQNGGELPKWAQLYQDAYSKK